MNQVVGLGFTGQMLGIVPMSSSGKPLCRAIIWLDSHADEQAERFIRRLGGRRMVTMLAGAMPSGKDVVCKFVWIKENEPDIYRDIHMFLNATGYLVFRATGNMIIGQTGAGGMGILDGKTREWSKVLAWVLGMDPARCPLSKAASISPES